FFVVPLPEHRHGLLVVGTCRWEMIPSLGDQSQQAERESHTPRISQASAPCQALLAQPFCPISVAPEIRQACSSIECLHLRRPFRPLAPRERPSEKAPPLTPVTTNFPEPPQCSC